MITLISFYEVLLFILTLIAIPLYAYFKGQEIEVRNKLAFTSQREVRRAVGRLSLVQEAYRKVVNRNTLNRLQYDLNDRPLDAAEDTGARAIKLTSNTHEYALLHRPSTYVLLLAFLVFFSNLAVSLFLFCNDSNIYF